MPLGPTRGRAASAASLGLYLAVALLLFGRDLHWRTDLMGSAPVEADAMGSVWFLGWWPWALRHGTDPLVASLDWFPLGYPLTWATAVPTAAAVAAPVTALAGAIAAYDLLTVTAPALAAWTAFLLCRAVTGDAAASLPAGALFGFSAYEAGQIGRHLNLDLVAPVPLLLLACHARLGKELSRALFIPALAVLLVLQFGISTELTLDVVGAGALVLALGFVLAPAPWRTRLATLGAEIAAAGLLAMLALGPWWVAMGAGASLVSAFVNPPGLYATDLANLAVPTAMTWLGHLPQAAAVAHRFGGNASEQGGYLGLPLLLVLPLWAREAARHWTGRALALAIAAIVVASLGPTLHVAGTDTAIPLPWRAALAVPLLRGALPCRLMMLASLGTALAVASWLATSPAGRRRRRVLLVLLALASLVPDPFAHPWAPAPLDPFFAPRHVADVLPGRPNVLVLPFAPDGRGLLWQWQSGMRFTETGGSFSFVPVPFQTATVLALETGHVGPSFAADIAAFCRTDRVSRVLVGPGTAPDLAAAFRALDWPARRDGDVVVLSPPPR